MTMTFRLGMNYLEYFSCVDKMFSIQGCLKGDVNAVFEQNTLEINENKENRNLLVLQISPWFKPC